MISSIEIRNFKCFRHLQLSLAGLTLFTGFNGGGKSSAIQPLLLLAQGLRSPSHPRAFSLNGPLVKLGTVADVLPADTNESTIKFVVLSPPEVGAWVFTAKSGDRFFGLEEGHLVDGTSSNGRVGTPSICYALETMTYLSAVRDGTADAYPIPDTGIAAHGEVGVDGSFAAYWYDVSVDNEVPPERRHPDEPATSFRKQLDAWLGALFPGAQANVQMLNQISMLSLQFRLSEIGDWRRPANVGYGFTYAFPIIVALLAADNDQVVVIDSPEAHLHPSAQSNMGRLLAHFAAAGVQIVVETHSDHLLNGARLAVKEGVLPHEALKIHFFMGAKEGEHGVISLSVDANGRIGEWPEGFFDQSEIDLSQLANWE